MERDLPLLARPAPAADATSIRQGDRRFTSRYLAMQLYDHHGLTDTTLRALGRVFSIKVDKAMSVEAGDPECSEKWAGILSALPDPDPADAIRFASQRSLSRDERKVLHRILRRHGDVPGAREAVAIALGLVDDDGWSDQVVLRERGMFKTDEFDRAVRAEAEFIVGTALRSSDLRARVAVRTERDEEPHTALSAVHAELLAEQTELSLVAADRGTSAEYIAGYAGVANETARRWSQRPDWAPRLRAEVGKVYQSRRNELAAPST